MVIGFLYHKLENITWFRHTFSNESWSGVIQPGASVTFGFQTSSSADLTASNILVSATNP
jgi:hypothetical protein